MNDTMKLPLAWILCNAYNNYRPAGAEKTVCFPAEAVEENRHGFEPRYTVLSLDTVSAKTLRACMIAYANGMDESDVCGFTRQEWCDAFMTLDGTKVMKFFEFKNSIFSLADSIAHVSDAAFVAWLNSADVGDTYTGDGFHHGTFHNGTKRLA